MEIKLSLIIYSIILVIIFIILRYIKYRSFTSFYIAVVFSVLLLLIIHPINSDGLDTINSENMLYYTIIGFSGLVFILYSMIMAINDKELN